MDIKEHLAKARAARKPENFARSAAQCRKAQRASVAARKAKADAVLAEKIALANAVIASADSERILKSDIAP